MLDSPIAMLAFILLFTLLFQDSPVAITSPQPRSELRGLIEIQGRMNSPEFESAELAFTFASLASDPAASWFVIQTFSQPVTDSIIAKWDTTAVTDGEYALRLRVKLKDGSFVDATIADLKIINNEPLPTATPPPTLVDFNFQPLDPAQNPIAEATPTQRIVLPPVTPLPVNPASLETSSIAGIFWQSALAVILLFAFFSLILRLRKP